MFDYSLQADCSTRNSLRFGTYIVTTHLCRNWSQHKYWLLRLFQQLLQKRGGAEAHFSDQSVFNKVITSVDKENAPNYALLLLWASQANATPVSVGVASYNGWGYYAIITCTDGVLDTLLHIVSSTSPSRTITGSDISSPSC